jgi:NAD(P)H-hydrate epimerase
MAEELHRISDIPRLPPRPAEGHKGLFGRVLVVGGNDGMIGAPVLAATAALRSGAGLVQLAVPRSILAAALSITPELIGLGLGKVARKDELLDAGEKADAIVLGPGLGLTPESGARVLRLIRLQRPMVIDADALNVLAAQKRWPGYFKGRAILTPHPGEMSRLGRFIGVREIPVDDDARSDLARKLSRLTGQVVLLKGHRTIVTDGQRLYINHSGDSTLSKAGSGDVLSGVIGCLLGQKMEPFEAGCLGAYLHGRAGEEAGRRLGRRCALARDVLDALAPVISEDEQR